MRARPLLCLAALAAGCVPRFALPMTGAELASFDSGPALVAYLSQPDASPTVCDVHANGPHVNPPDDQMRRWLVDGLRSGRVEPRVWRRCVDAFLRALDPGAAAALLDDAGRAYRKLMKDSDFERSPAMQARLAALHQLYVERPHGLDPHPDVMAGLLDDLRRAVARGRVGASAARFGGDLLATVDLERGMWQGQPIDLAALDRLLKSGDEALLRRCVDRLPDEKLRAEARRRVIRLHILASPFPEVRQNLATVENIVMKLGAYPISPADYPPLRGRLDPARVPVRGVLVRQQVWDQTATLLGYAGERPGVSVLPELSLRGALEIELQGISRPVTLCGPAKELDVTPCLDARDVKLDNPAAYLDQDGAFHFVEHVAARDAVNLAQKGDRFVLPVSVGARTLLQLDWGLYYERPEDSIFPGGPDLRVTAEHRYAGRFIFTVQVGGRGYLAAVEMPDVAAFHIVSRGPQGASGRPGHPGLDGRRGVDGSAAYCPSTAGGAGGAGEDGTHGGHGGPGGPGGDGGDILVDVQCGGRPCQDALALLGQSIFSEAGAGGFGGPGGAGGLGGAGGTGGSGTSCTDSSGNGVSLPPGPDGRRGRDGYRGHDGPPGPPGRAGSTNFRVVR